LVVPGVLTDVVGVLFLVPFTRRLFVRSLLARMQRALQNGRLHVAQAHVGTYGSASPFMHAPGQQRRSGAANGVIDVEGELVQPPTTPRALRDDND
jgi:UPF0716 family protein affecting phage T7 exclusion